MGALAKALTFALAILACGCTGADSDQIRLCRMVPVGLHEPGGTVVVTATRAGLRPYSVEISYTHISEAKGQSTHRVSCLFGGGRWSRDRQELVELVSDGRVFGEVSLYLLKRFWLSEPHAALLAPQISRTELAGIRELDRETAIASQHVLASLPKIAIYALLAPAYALIYGLVGRVNLAFGELAVLGGHGAMIGAIGANMLMPNASMFLLLSSAVIAAMAVSSIHGHLMARVVFARLVSYPGQAVTIASLGLTVLCMEYVRLAQSNGTQWMPPILTTSVIVAHHDTFLVTITEGAIVATATACFVAAALVFSMQKTAFGRRWRAVADDARAAELFGVDAPKVLMQSFAVSGLLAGLSGAIVFAHYGGVGFSGGLVMGLKALVGAVIGGIGSVPGAILGAILIGTFEASWSALFPIEQSDIAILVVLVVFLILRPTGLLGVGGQNQAQV